jgi:hypothetical protein
MRVPNLSIRALMVVIAFCAISAAVVREEARPISGFIVNGSLPMLSALLLGTLLKASSDRARRFLAGFQLFGWIAIVGLSAAYFYLPSFARWYFSLGYLQPAALTGALPPWPRADSLRIAGVDFRRPDYRMGLLYFLHTLSVTGPELVIALLGGLLFCSVHRRTRSWQWKS